MADKRSRGTGAAPSAAADTAVGAGLRQQHARAGGLARLEVAVRLRGVGQRITLIDADLHRADVTIANRSSAIACVRLARGGVRKQRRPRQVQRALGGEQARLNGGTGPDALPKLASSPNGRRQSSERSKVSLPIESYTTFTPLPPVISFTRATKSSRR